MAIKVNLECCDRQ